MRAVVRTTHAWGEFSTSLIDDLVQETYLKLCADDCRLLRNFESRQTDAIYGYLKVITTNLVHDHLKSHHAAKRGSGEAARRLWIFRGLKSAHYPIDSHLRDFDSRKHSL